MKSAATAETATQAATLPFKMILVTLRDYLKDLSGSELKVWLYQYLRSGKECTSYPMLETISQQTGLCQDTVVDCRRTLIKKGLLKRLGRKRNPDGTLGAAEYEAIMPD